MGQCYKMHDPVSISGWEFNLSLTFESKARSYPSDASLDKPQTEPMVERLDSDKCTSKLLPNKVL